MPSAKRPYPPPPAPPLLCIDVSYLLFYRLNALQTWYKHAHGEAPDAAAMASEPFRTKLLERLDATMVDLVRRHKPFQVLLAYDGRHNWRRECSPSYKGTRKHDPTTLALFRHGETHMKLTYGGGDTRTSDAPPTLVSTLSSALAAPRFPPTLDPPSVVSLQHDALEADDLVHFRTRQHMTADPATHTTVIIANDHDYLPLLEYPRVYIARLPNTLLALPKHSSTPQAFLVRKVLLGDKSDNIGPIAPRLAKRAAELAHHPTKLRAFLAQSDDATRIRFDQNRILVDNRLTPEPLQEWMRQAFNATAR